MQKLIAFFLVITIGLMSITKPAFAESNMSSIAFSNTSSVVDKIVDKATDAAIGMATFMAICYGADALATTVFPPVAIVAPFCPMIAAGTGATVEATKGVAKLVQLAH